MKNSYRITKYKKYNSEGFLCSDTWSSFYDIGEKTTLEEYLKVEKEYIEIIKKICKHLNIDHLVISDIEINEKDFSKIKNTDEISSIQIDDIVKAIFREKVWCKLKSKICEFHFGYDMYMYCVTDIDIFQFLKDNANILNIEAFNSPYLE